MDSKFRKLISRLSIKEKNKQGIPRTISISPLPDNYAEDDENEEIPYNNKYHGLMNRNSVSQTNLLLNSKMNILTNVQFPCPTLLRKTKSMNENIYEEVKPTRRVIVHGLSPVKPPVAEEESQHDNENNEDPPPSSELNSTEVVQVDENNNEVVVSTSTYTNLQELEQERRRLISAQAVRAKYAENWIDGQVVEESILGDNREKTKLYWETRMRHDTSEKEKANGYNKFRSSSTGTSSVVQKMNAEMKELHRRERELSHKSKVAEDEDDVFSSSNGSSVDEFEHAESPRLESGFYSNVGEDEPFNTESPDLKGSLIITTETREVDLERSNTPLTIVTQQVHIEVQGSASNDLLEAVPDSPSPRIFTFQIKETPIEREIRLASERDEEHRLRRQSSVATPDFQSSIPATPSTPTAKASAASTKDDSSNATPTSVKPSVIKEKERRSSGAREPIRILQYKMATERLKKEILEVKQREDELKARGKVKSVSSVSETVEQHSPQIAVEPIIEAKVELKVERTLPAPVLDTEPVIVKSKAKSEVHAAIPDSREASPAPKSAGIERRTSSVSGDGEMSQFKILGRPSFNSIQRYLLKSSAQLRIAKNFQLPPPTIPEPESDKVETKEDEVEDEPVTPRRKLVPAQHKIEKELREMREREKELALIRTRSFKSTPNLSTIDKDDDEVEIASPVPAHEAEFIELNNNNEVKKSSFEPKDRKRSNLINEWEGKIQAGN